MEELTIFRIKINKISMVLKKLYLSFMLLSSCQGFKCSKISSFTGLWVGFTRVDPVFTGLQFTYHVITFSNE